jgi:nicotinate-nucleotide adenylyltransferase
MKLGIFGGTFNPIHTGHLRVAEEVRYSCGLDRVIFVPSGSPPLKTSELADARHRVAMTRVATQSNNHFDVSDIEMQASDKSYTISTVQKLCEIYPGDKLYFIMGLDVFLDLPNWREPERLISLIDFIIMTRPGFRLDDLQSSPFIGDSGCMSDSGIVNCCLKGGRTAVVAQVTACDFSSTVIRQLLKEGKSVKYLMPEAVEQYIASNRLYKAYDVS